MSRLKTSLVLEGGGMRGAYTAGSLTWLIDHDIEFDNAYGISTGAVHLVNFLLKNKKDLFDFSTDAIADKRAIGIRAILRCGRIVDYDFVFDELMVAQRGFDMSGLKNITTDGYVGLYELDKGLTVYYPVKEMNLDELKASTSLPIIGKIVNDNGKEILDGGITDMIPIRKSVEDGCNRHLIITTKPGNYVRKPAKPAIVKLMKMTYPQCDRISHDYEVRHLNYQDQISMIKDLEDKGEAVYSYPSKESKVTRLGGSKEELSVLFNLGYEDMEMRKDAIFRLLGV